MKLVLVIDDCLDKIWIGLGEGVRVRLLLEDIFFEIFIIKCQ